MVLFITVGPGKGVSTGGEESSAGTRRSVPLSEQPGHGEGASGLLSPLCHCRVPQALQLPAPHPEMPFPCLFTGFSNSQLGAFLR